MTRNAKRAEKFLIRKFLESLGYDVPRLAGGERPDARATVSRDGRTSRLGVELTLYHVDAAPGTKKGSHGSQLHAFWQEVQRSLFRRLNPRRTPLTLDVHVSLKRGVKTYPSEARSLAAELVAFAQENAPKPGQRVSVKAFPGTYPLIEKYMRKVIVSNIAPAVAFHWGCTEASTASVGVVVEHVTKHVETKGRKCRTYKWGNVDGRWLLICASGWPIVSSAGPRPESVDWRSAELVEACISSGFDKIFFYERPWEWCQQVWPYRPAIKSRARKRP